MKEKERKDELNVDERVRGIVEEDKFVIDEGKRRERMKVRVGVEEIRKEGERIEEILKREKEEIIKEKKRGRNRIVL